jgi:hypothetical protein
MTEPIRKTAPPMNGVAVASVSLGFFSLVVYWWYPFALILSTAGLVIGLSCLAVKLRGGLRGENMALIGTTLCAISFTVIITLTQALHFMMWWDH